MNLTNEPNAIIQSIRPHITHFSEEIRAFGKDNDSVICGGEIIRVLNLPAAGIEEAAIVYVTIDDAVGQSILLVPTKIWEEEGCDIGTIIIAEGILNSINKATEFKTKANTNVLITRPGEPIRVLAKSIIRVEGMDEFS